MKVILSHKAHLKMKYYIEEINYEISGLGTVETLSNGDLFVSDIYLFEQEVSAAATTLKAEDLDKFYDTLLNQEFANEEEREEMFDQIGKIKLWWHSHVNMDTFWSTTDTDTQDSLDIDQPTENWWLSIVGNKKGERRAKLDVYKPHRMFMDNLDIVIGEDNDLREEIKKEIEEKVTVTTPIVDTTKQFRGIKNWGKKGRTNWKGRGGFNKDYRSAPKTSDMQDMVDNITGWDKQNGIYVPRADKKLKKANNKKL